jgi:hypothetical protein
MGGRGAFEKSGSTGIKEEFREYSTIGYLNHIKIVQWNKGKNNSTITYSNTKNTTYYSYSKEHKRIEHIYYYRNHRLVKSVDFYDKQNNLAPHTHYWGKNGPVGRKKHDPKNTFTMNEKDMRLYKSAIKWNSGHGR